jgi:hypothetical protein
MIRDLACYAAKALQGNFGELAVSWQLPGARSQLHPSVPGTRLWPFHHLPAVYACTLLACTLTASPALPPIHPPSPLQTRNEQGGQRLLRALLTLLHQEREDAWVRQITTGGSLPAVPCLLCLH